MAEHILLVMAERSGKLIAGALNFIGSHALYGRNWGAIEHHPNLHFETCYYQAIDFAISPEAGPRGGRRTGRPQAGARLSSAKNLQPALSGASRPVARGRALSEESANAEKGPCGPFALPRKWTSNRSISYLSMALAAHMFRRKSSRQEEGVLSPKRERGEPMSYDTNNIFAKILRGEIPCHKVYEDEHTLAFMDVMPQVDGHTLVIPKSALAQPARCRSRRPGPLMASVQKVANAVRKASMLKAS
jgi:hypothetical protein